MAEPRKITAGDSVSWTRTEALYPASAGWKLVYYLSCGAAAPIKVESSASGDEHAVAVTAATTKAWPAGSYAWTVRAEKGDEARAIATGWLTIAPDPSATVDRRTHAQKALASIEAALESSVGSATVECELDGVRVKKDRSELLRLRNYYRAEVRRERGIPAMTCIPVRLG